MPPPFIDNIPSFITFSTSNYQIYNFIAFCQFISTAENVKNAEINSACSVFSAVYFDLTIRLISNVGPPKFNNNPSFKPVAFK
jgi:hypothetical protein